MNQPSRWGALIQSLQEALYERLRGKGVGILHVTLIVVDGELVCWSDPRMTSLGPYSSTRELADCLAKLPEVHGTA